MKKLLKTVVISIAFAMLFTACGKQPPEESIAVAMAHHHCRMMQEGMFEDVVADFDNTMTERLTADRLKEAYNSVTALAGSYTGIYITSYQHDKGMAVVYYRMQHENLTVCLKFAYNPEGEISGLWLSTEAPESNLTENEIFAETAITVGRHNLKGVLTLPKNTEISHVAVLVQGSGSSDYDETVGGCKPFRDIAHALAEKGIASVRVNKRFYQKPETATADMTIYDEYMDDVYAAVEYAKNNVSENVYIVGHSQGGMSAPKIATDTGAKGIIMMAGTIHGLEDVLYEQNMALIDHTAGLSDDEKQAMKIQIGDEVAKVKELKEGDTAAPFGIPSTYWLSLKELKTEEYLADTELPVLIMQGTEDFQVSYEYDYRKMERLFAGKDNFVFKAYEGLNHMFMPQTRPGVMDVSEYADPNSIPDYVTDDIADFILAEN